MLCHNVSERGKVAYSHDCLHAILVCDKKEMLFDKYRKRTNMSVVFFFE